MTEITSALPADAESILELQKRAYQSEAQLYNDWSLPPLTQSLESLRHEIAAITVLKATREGVLVGSVRAALAGEICAVGRLMVEPRLQGQGIGSALLNAIETYLPTARTFELFTGSRSHGNLRLYQRHGYVETRREEVSPQLTLVFLRKQTPPAA